ncbi:MAG: hypothetical protein ACLUI3_05105 [Christensenellales bacterium]
MDKMGDVQSLSDQYDTMLDFTPPDGPYLSGDSKNKKVCYVEACDDLSGWTASPTTAAKRGSPATTRRRTT